MKNVHSPAEKIIQIRQCAHVQKDMTKTRRMMQKNNPKKKNESTIYRKEESRNTPKRC